MGQAKRRGTFEERKAQSAERFRAALERRRAELDAIHARNRAALEAHPGRRRRSTAFPIIIGAALAASLSS